MFIYVRIVVVLMYSIDEDRIEQNQGENQLSDWLELSENRCARTNSHLVAAERIIIHRLMGCRLVRATLTPPQRGRCLIPIRTNKIA
jgi:hypothetical protein